MATTSDVIEALKYTYGTDQVLYLLNQEVVCWNMFQKMAKPMGGRGQFILPIMTKNPGAWTGITEGGALPSNINPSPGPSPERFRGGQAKKGLQMSRGDT